jgi:NADH-quinone oxidoreductase subunit L
VSIFDLTWLIPVVPFLAFVAIALGAHRRQALSRGVALAGIVVAFVLSQLVFWATALRPPEHGAPAFASRLPWLAVGHARADVGVYIDAVSALMLFMVPLVCLMIFIYSVGYMHGDPQYSRFFAYISLFATGMLGLVVCDGLLPLFIFWEIMGTCSYLLIGFWYRRPSAVAAGLKAFLVTKVGDLFLLLGLVLLYDAVGSLTYADVFAPVTLRRLAATPFMGTRASLATVIALLLFGGTVGKSAQFPLHVWLPDAMEGPTPVSALIHAATMVSAGVYLVARAFPLFAVSEGLGVVAFVGTLTALFASLIAVAQDDIKRVLAFSTISQLGYMVAALGIGAYGAAVFHLITHAFFKALLFLASGSVIHGMEHAHHALVHARPTGDADFDPNDMRGMGGLARRMPRTAAAFLAGGLALSGFPLITAGFWSKDEILAQAWARNPAVFWPLAVAAALTAFYTARQLCLTFLGAPRSPVAAHVSESAPSMTVPLLVLAVFALTLGWVGIPASFPLVGGLLPNWIHHFVGEGFPGMAVEAAAWQPLVLGLALALGGLGAGVWLYGRRPLPAGAPDPVAAALRAVRLGWVYEALRRRLYVDALYRATVVRATVWLAETFYLVDRDAVDATVVGVARGITRVSRGAGWADVHLIDALLDALGGVGRSLAGAAYAVDRYLIDMLVRFLGWLGRGLAQLSAFFDAGIVDGLVRGFARGVRRLGREVRRLQTGLLHDYIWNALLMVLLLTAILILFQRM